MKAKDIKKVVKGVPEKKFYAGTLEDLSDRVFNNGFEPGASYLVTHDEVYVLNNMINVQKQFGKYTITYSVEPYNDSLYQHIFEVALTGTLERTLIEHIIKRKKPDITIYFENYYDCIQRKHRHLASMTVKDWEDIFG